MLSSGLLSLVLASAALAWPSPYPTASNVFNVAGSGGNKSSPYQYGIIFEDINHSGDGGIYAELIMNRAFQSYNISTATVAPFYSPSGAKLTLQESNPLTSALPISMNVACNGTCSFANPGFWGIDVQPYEYTGEFYVFGSYSGNIVASLVSNITGEVFATTTIPTTSTTNGWTHVTYTLQPSAAAPNSNNSLLISFDGSKATAGSLNFNFISLFPPTYDNQPNGMRIDLMNALADLNPSFIRMPGGNNMEGNGPLEGSPAWPWNMTIGPLIDRPGHMGAWGYYNTDGLGLNEYFRWAQDLNMEPILAVPDGHYIDFEVVPEDQIQAWVQDALDEVEYLTAPVGTPAGDLRASHGYPTPWPLKYVEIGNEDNLFNGTASYLAYRWEAFATAFAKTYPDLILIADTQYIGPETGLADGQGNDYHTYFTPDTGVEQYNYFDQNTTSTFTLVGEYAAVDPNAPGGVNWNAPLFPHPFWVGSVAEAVFTIGTERNTGKVFGAAYAPILANVNSEQWRTDLIYFDAEQSGTSLSTSWYVIELLSNTRFTTTRQVTTSAPTGPLYWVAGENEDSGSYIFKTAVYNSTNGTNVPLTVNFPNIRPGTQANLTYLTAPDAYSYNGIGMPQVVKTTTQILQANWQGGFTFELPNYSVAVLATQPPSVPSWPGFPWGWGGSWSKASQGGFGGCKTGGWTGSMPWGHSC